MKTSKRLKYKSETGIQQIRSNISVILTYVFLIWMWQFTLSFQSSMYMLMNVAVFVMFAFGAIGVIFCKEDRETILKHTKFQIASYLAAVFVYDLFLRVVVDNMMYTSLGSEADPSLLVARQFLLVLSTILKIGFPIAFVVWSLQKLNVFKNGLSKQKQIEVLRNIRRPKK